MGHRKAGPLMGNGRAWALLTHCGIDVVVGGTCAEFFVILLAVATTNEGTGDSSAWREGEG
ncbi:hypothetical protein [Streptomyces sp. ISL-98]|uniref:hypothetical protein n=1 Tax=Streptomyces sp. ISL-98 TaxID=2819192 RepID=UPI002035FC73|nr:hypothetical protein [Streptomyces sp. ISL-98]